MSQDKQELTPSTIFYGGILYNQFDKPIKNMTRCLNQHVWDTVQRRILYVLFKIPYEWIDLDQSAHIFDNNKTYKDLTITFRDTIDNVEQFIEHPSIFVLSVNQHPLEDIYGNRPTSDWVKVKYEYSKNWVNGLFVQQEQACYNVSDDFDFDYIQTNLACSRSTALIKNSIYTRSNNQKVPSKSPYVFVDLINPDERIYDITFRIASEYFIATKVMEYKLFDIIQDKFGNKNRTYLTCAQFLSALEMLEHVQKTGTYWMRVHNLSKEPQKDFNWQLYGNKIGKLMAEYSKNNLEK